MDSNTNILKEEYTRGISKFMMLSQRQPEANTGMLRCICSTCKIIGILKIRMFGLICT